MNITSVKRIHQSDWRKKGIPFYRARDITALSKNLNIEEPIFISRDLYEEYSKISGKVQINDLLVTGVGTIGVPLLVQTVPLYFKDGNIIWFQNSNKLIGLFFLYLFKTNTVQKYIHTTTGVGTVPTYTIQSGKNTPVYITSKKEQKDIGTIFQLIDNLISLQQRKLKLLNKLKKGLINNILSSVLHFTSTKSVEHIVTFGDIFNYERPDNYIVSSENYVSSGIPVLTANKSFILGYSNENHPYNKGKAIIFDDFTLESKLVNFNFMVKSSAIKILTTKPSYDIDFCFVLLKNTPLIQEGHARHYISRVQPTKVKVPNLTLQRKYAKIFNTLEYKIRNSNSIQENLKLLKQFLLQNMFI
ncbi:MAG: restriction endonuclease subunit S [Mollicutes bacterium]|nr:restriction endonuclease subunit S [Mollicutes bacterium]